MDVNNPLKMVSIGIDPYPVSNHICFDDRQEDDDHE
jgi:hypothetical protein